MNKIKTLIPLSEFVSKIDEICPIEVHEMSYDHAERQLELIERYNKFLLQPLNIGMFVPCDEKGNVLSEPDPISIGKCISKKYKTYEPIYDKKEEESYLFAKSKTLFKGFYVRNTELDGDDITKVVTNEKEYPFHFQDGQWKIGLGNKVVDDLLKSNVLTEQSLKQIYG